MEFWKLQGHFQEYEIILKQPRIAYMRPKNWRLRHAAQENNHYRIIDLKKDFWSEIFTSYSDIQWRILIKIYSFILTKSNTDFRKDIVKPPSYSRIYWSKILVICCCYAKSTRSLSNKKSNDYESFSSTLEMIYPNLYKYTNFW